MRNKKIRNRKSKRPPIFFKKIIIGIVISITIIFVFFVALRSTLKFIKTSGYFVIKEIVYPKSLEFTEKDSIESLKGKSIFEVDIKKAERVLKMRCPQCAGLRVSRRFPSQILITAKKRSPFAQAKIGKQILVIDKEGIVLSVNKDPSQEMPVITGLQISKSKIKTGYSLKTPRLQAAFLIIRPFKKSKAHSISKINVSRLSEIYFYINNTLKVIIDDKDIERKLKILKVLLVRTKSEFVNLRYIDLRFKEPVVGKK